jgi:murein DD-endopeptidase MepM/ murein hydrolase activator NlpD
MEAASSAGPRVSRDRAVRVALGVTGGLVVLGAGLLAFSPRGGEERTPAPALAVASPERSVADSGAAEVAIEVGADTDAGRPPPAWRVARLKDDASVEVVEGTFAKKGFVATLSQVGLARTEIRRVVQAFDGVYPVERPHESDAFVLAKDRSKGTVVAFELISSPADVWQARLDDAQPNTDRLITRRLDLFVEHRQLARTLVVTADLGKAIAAAGMRPEIALAIDDALHAHVDPGAIRAGVRLRVAATEEWVEGSLTRTYVDAVELVPKGGAPVRVYYYARDPQEGASRRAPAPGFYDAKGKQPYRGQFRSPLALARVTSRFNPHRLHPVLKTVMPHRGVDFGASMGTPVYASAGGTVVSAANSGPCGNMVELDHGGGLHTAYCHLSAFARGLHAGDHVEPRQLVGYVGRTGRVTGPHLHFAVKRNGVFVDPLALKMDGVKVLPSSDRDAFARRRAELDAILDGVPLPTAADVPEEPDEDKDLPDE